ncbi:MAG: hypothetical protein JNL50_03665 [Phycisphaerae bacterium]|nr:hypothetical protein [Phycisphaerae bacterium]
MPSRLTHILAASVALFLAAPAAFAQDSKPSTIAATAEAHAKAVVSIKMSLKYEGSFGEHEQEREVTGVIIDASGLILCSNSQSGGVPPSMQDRMSGVTVTPRDIKVTVENNEDALDAKLIARDSELDLAWIKVSELKGMTLTSIDLAAAATPALADEMVGVGRLSKYFDHAPMLTFCRVSALAKKPRNLIIPSDMNDLGIPVFTNSGKLVGVTIVQLPEVDEDNDEDMRSQLRGLGASMVILPAADVAAATKHALETADADAPTPADKQADKPADAPTPADKPADPAIDSTEE